MSSKLKEAVCKDWPVLISFAILTLLGLTIFRNWLFTGEWPGGGDVLGWISKAYVWSDFRWFYVWRSYSFGFVEGVAIDPKNLLLIALYNVCGNPQLTVKIFTFAFFLVAGFSIYTFTYRHTHHHMGSLAASMVYVLNPWMFSQLTEAHLDILFSYALAPLIFLLFDRMLKTGKPRDILVSALGLWVVVTSFHVEFAVIYGMFLGIFVVFYIIFPTENTMRKRLTHSLRSLVPLILIAIPLAASFLTPLFSRTASPYLSASFGYPLEWAYTTSYKNMTDAFMLKANEQWGYTRIVNLETGISLPDFPISDFLLPLFLIVYAIVLLIKTDRYTVFFTVSSLISLFLSKGPNPPFGYVFSWAWFNLPYFSVFRAASRWNAMTPFSLAFFVSIFVSRLVPFVRTNYSQTSKSFLNFDMKVGNGSVVSVQFSSPRISNILKKSRNFLRFIGVVLLICIFSSSFLASFFFFSQGLQVYTPPNEYLQPFKWIQTQKGNYRVVTVGSSLYFADPSMTTDLGAGHDIGYESYFIDDKSTLQEGGYDSNSRNFVNYLQNYIVPQSVTSSVSQMLGSFNYRYTVIPPYANDNTRNFFLNQTGAKLVFNQSSLVLENNYDPPIFVANQHAIVLGGLESFHSLYTIDSFGLNKTALIFADQVWDNSLEFQRFLNTSDELIMVDSDPMDLVMLSLKNEACWLSAALYGVRSLNDSQFWIPSSDWENTGKLVLSKATLRTTGKCTIDMPFEVKTTGNYEIWARMGFGPNQGALDFFIDKKQIETVGTHQSSKSMRWINLSSPNITGGSHMISASSHGDGFCDIDVIAVVEPHVVASEAERTAGIIQQFSGRQICFWQAEDLFSQNLPQEWVPTSYPYEGVALNTLGIGHNVSPEGSANASSVFDFGPSNAIDRDPTTRWASRSGMPQWLEVDWNSTQNLTGVEISFERAVAEDYVVESWNGTQWVTQIRVEGNEELERVHSFPQVVKTTKIRVYVTKASAFNLVSIYELKCYSSDYEPKLSAVVHIPTSSRYLIALRVATNSGDGFLRMEVANFSEIVPYSSTEKGFYWYETPPYDLVAGNCTISISAFGQIKLDAIVLYSISGNEDSLPVENLFRSNLNQTFVDYAVVNPCNYNLHVRSDGPFFLVFSDSYDPLWTLHMTNGEAPHIITDSFLNGYLINETGDFNLTLSFEGQTYANLGVGISIAAFVVIATYSVYKSVLLKRFLHKLRRNSKHLVEDSDRKA
jgi:hypothetical protein